jgi:hypothetical protein
VVGAAVVGEKLRGGGTGVGRVGGGEVTEFTFLVITAEVWRPEDAGSATGVLTGGEVICGGRKALAAGEIGSAICIGS